MCLTQIPYSVILEAFETVKPLKHFKPNLVYGRTLELLKLENSKCDRSLLSKIIGLFKKNQLSQDGPTPSQLSPPTAFENLAIDDVLRVFGTLQIDAITSTTFRDQTAIFGKSAELLGGENTIHEREYLQKLYFANFLEKFEMKTHEQIFKAMAVIDHRCSSRPNDTKSMFGKLASLLRLANNVPNRKLLAQWKEIFAEQTKMFSPPNVIISSTTRKRPLQRKSDDTNFPTKRTRPLSKYKANVHSNIPANVDTILKITTDKFHSLVHQYPDKACEICRRLMYTLFQAPLSTFNEYIRHQFEFTLNSRTDYPNCSKIETILVCKRCLASRKSKKTPAQAFFNQLLMEDIPDQIKGLTNAELQLISQVRPFMKIFYLSKGRGQQAIKGSVVHFPSSLKELCKVLPLNNKDSDMVVIHERIEGLENHQDFTVRGDKIITALAWLKLNNWLYKDVNICVQDELEIQPVTILADIACNDVPTRNIPATLTRYMSISDTKRILRASCHQSTTERFPSFSRGRQCTSMAVTFAAYSSIQNPATWTMETLDEVLLRGDRLYLSRARNRQFLTVVEAQGEINDIFGAITVNVEAIEQVHGYSGQLNRLASLLSQSHQPQVLKLSIAISCFMNSTFEYGILTVGEYSMGLFKFHQKLYYFDSHSRGPRGAVAENGCACLLEYSSTRGAEELSTLIHRNLEPKVTPCMSMSVMQLQHYLFNIVPLRLVSNQEQPPNDPSTSIRTGQPTAEVVDSRSIPDNLSVICQQEKTFGENMLVDSVLHNIDYHVPEVQDIVEAAKKELIINKQRERPLYPNQEDFLEELCFVKMFPFGKGGLSTIRQIKITPLDYFQSRIMSNDTRFWDNAYLFYALSRTEEHRVKQKIAICGEMKYVQNNNQGNVEYPGLVNVHLYMSAIRGSASYWKNYTGNLIAFIAQRGIPTIFLTISSDDLNSTDSLLGLIHADSMRDQSKFKDLAIECCNLASERDFEGLKMKLESLSYEEKSDLLNRNPVQAARHFHHRVNALMSLLKQSGKEIFGYDLDDYTYRVEFQNRGSAHIHMLLWLKDAPSDYRSTEGIELIEKNMCCAIPDDDAELKNLVLKYQNHRHTGTCFKNNSKYCRFDFPKKISAETVVLDEDDIHRNKGRFIVLKRNESESFVNNYHPILLKILKCNMDLQFVTDANAIAYYIAKYISKAEPTDLQDEIQSMLQKMQLNSSASYYQMATKIAMQIMSKRQVGAPEAAYRMCHLKLRYSSRGFVFIPIYQPEKRLHIIRKETIGKENVKMGISLIEKYCLRPDSLAEICLLEFAALYTPCRKEIANEQSDPDSSEDENEPPCLAIKYNTINLKNNTKMKLRKKHAIVKYPNFDPIKQKDDYYYGMILLYYPFTKEEDILFNHSNVIEAFKALSPKFRQSTDAEFLRPDLALEIDRAMVRIQNFDDSLSQDEAEDENVPYEYGEDNAEIPEPGEIFQPINDVGNLHQRYHSLSPEQKEVFQKVKSKLDDPESSQVLAYISGAGGTGKSYLIDTLSALIRSYKINNGNALLKAAPTGMSALNINATTIHRAFKLPVQRGYIPPYSPLNSKNLEYMRAALRDVEWIIIDEISMVAYQYFRTIHLRLGEIKRNEDPFAGINFLVFGDLMQFRPVNGAWIFKPPAIYLHETNLWKLFDFYELFTNHRQTGDSRYLELLDRLRFGQCTMEDLSLLESRIFDTDIEKDAQLYQKFADALALFPDGTNVNKFNADKTLELKEQLKRINKRTYIVKSHDTYAAGSHFDETVPDKLVPNKERLTAGVPGTLELGEGSRVMLRRNMSLTDGLVNGSVGTIKGIKWTACRDGQLKEGDLPEYIIIHFDGNMGGQKKDLNGYVKIECVTVEFVGKRQILIKRRMFPIVLCWALVFHKCQGLTLHYASINLAVRQFAKAMSYVALSRVKSRDGLRILGLKDKYVLTLKERETPCDTDAVKEVYRLRLMKIGVVEDDMEIMLQWILDFPVCVRCKKWICACKC